MLPATVSDPAPEVCAVHVQAAMSATAPPDAVIALHGDRVVVAPATALPPGAVVLAGRADLERLLDDETTADEAAAAHQVAATVTDWADIHSDAAA
ncbi:hypothetical protein NI17_024055 (plasmid) [Thermobifida halotolerans]|uniref:Uncharacterized protein n=2 Tax=Thermobifida halotolerans TaxID=483545 RepID=A0AA97M2C0_9ACTN|nr:hypothetical protein [Thermobifida halotolerans]UOE22288.1 hypothetical protein NI17_024055 [Thermobifida halotolerans]